MSRLNNKYGKGSKKGKSSRDLLQKNLFSTRAKDKTTPTIPTLMPIIRRRNTTLQLSNMGGVTRVGRGAILQILLWGGEGDLTGQEWCTAVPKSLLNPPRTGSKTDRHGVLEKFFRTSLFFVFIGLVTV